jgi:hypothetical protein
MKKKIPLAILEVLQPIVDTNLELVLPVKNNEVIFHLMDNDENSDFFFKVVKQEMSNGNPGYIIEYKPRNKDDVSVHKTWTKLESINNVVTQWLDLISAYNKIQTIYDDPILKSNQERFEKEFEILDKDAGTSTFNLHQQLFLDDYLNDVKSKIIRLKEGRDSEKILELDELEKDAVSIQNDLTRQTKRKIIQRLSKFWAKSQKIGLDVIKEVFVSVTAELAKKLITGP